MSGTISWDPEVYARNARFVSDLGAPLLQLLDPKPGEVILDLGCGDGALTEKIISFGATVYGVDSSPPQVRAATKRGLQTAVMDGHYCCFRTSFDAVFSNAALHWMKQPARVLDGVHGALKAQGRFVGELGGKGNVQTIHAALNSGLRHHGIDPLMVDPWYYPSVEEYSQLLTQTGFEVIYIDLIPRPTPLPDDIMGWLEVFAQPFSNSLPCAERKPYLTEVRELIKETLQNPDGSWFADYVRLRFKALRTGKR
jgi:trans-aconitate methyltransferase